MLFSIGRRSHQRVRDIERERGPMSDLGLDDDAADGQRLLLGTLNAVEDGIILLAPGCRIVWANAWVEAKLAAQGPLVGKPCEAVFPGFFVPCSDCDDGSQSGSGRLSSRVVTYPSTGEPVGWLEIQATRLGPSGDSRVCGVLHLKDVSEERRAEEALRNEIRWRRLVVEQSRDGIVILDQGGRVFEANQEFARMVGYSMEEMGSLSVWDWEAAAPRDRVQEMITSVDGDGDHFETRHRRKDGTQYEVEISSNGVMYGEKKYIFCVCRDITERKRAEREREALINKLQDALGEIKALRGLVPVCSYCNKIRDEKGSWELVDAYIARHSAAGVTHGICPDCMKERFPQLCEEDD